MADELTPNLDAFIARLNEATVALAGVPETFAKLTESAELAHTQFIKLADKITKQEVETKLFFESLEKLGKVITTFDPGRGAAADTTKPPASGAPTGSKVPASAATPAETQITTALTALQDSLTKSTEAYTKAQADLAKKTAKGAAGAITSAQMIADAAGEKVSKITALLQKKQLELVDANTEATLARLRAAQDSLTVFADENKKNFASSDKVFAAYYKKQLLAQQYNVLKLAEEAKKTGKFTVDQHKETTKKVAESEVAATSKMQKYAAVLSSVGVAAPKTVQLMSDLAGAMGFMGVSAFMLTAGAGVAAGALILVIKQLFEFAADAAKSIPIVARLGGITAKTSDLTYAMANSMQTALVGSVDANKYMVAALDEYGVQLGKVVSVTGDATKVFRVNTGAQADLTAEFVESMQRTVPLGKLFGLSAEQVGKAMGGLAARFHIVPAEIEGTFTALGKISGGAGISISHLTSIISSAGDKLRYWGGDIKKVSLQYSNFSGIMRNLSATGDKFWKNLGEGEMFEAMSKITDLWKTITPQMYLGFSGLINGPQSIGAIADKIGKFYKTTALEGMSRMADNLTNVLTRSGELNQDQARIMLSAAGPFASFKDAAPAFLKALSDPILREQTQGMNMEQYLKAAQKAHPESLDSFRKIADAQSFALDPLQSIARATVMILRTMIYWTKNPLFGSINGLVSALNTTNSVQSILDLGSGSAANKMLGEAT